MNFTDLQINRYDEEQKMKWRDGESAKDFFRVLRFLGSWVSKHRDFSKEISNEQKKDHG